METTKTSDSPPDSPNDDGLDMQDLQEDSQQLRAARLLISMVGVYINAVLLVHLYRRPRPTLEGTWITFVHIVVSIWLLLSNQKPTLEIVMRAFLMLPMLLTFAIGYNLLWTIVDHEARRMTA